jgi:hypothetical protein
LRGVPLLCISADDPARCAAQLPNPTYAVGVNEFVTAGGVCRGDSGGPALDDAPSGARLLGVVSRAEYDPTPCGTAIYARLDRFRPQLLEAVAFGSSLGGYPVPAWAQRRVGDSCTVDEDCGSSGHCAGDAGDARICSAPPEAQGCAVAQRATSEGVLPSFSPALWAAAACFGAFALRRRGVRGRA